MDELALTTVMAPESLILKINSSEFIMQWTHYKAEIRIYWYLQYYICNLSFIYRIPLVLYIICLKTAAGAAFWVYFPTLIRNAKARRKRWFFRKNYKLPPSKHQKMAEGGGVIDKYGDAYRGSKLVSNHSLNVSDCFGTDFRPTEWIQSDFTENAL